MDPNALYAALNTVAQCAAALAALIGFLGLWRLDRLRAEREQALQLIYRRPYNSLGADLEIARLGEEFFVQNAEAYVRGLEQALGTEGPAGLKLKQATARWRAIPGEQRQLIGVLQRFLRRTLVILALAISGLVVVDALYSWVLTRWLTGLLIIFAAYRLWRDTYAVVREAARSVRTLVILALVLLASPALAGPVRCTTYAMFVSAETNEARVLKEFPSYQHPLGKTARSIVIAPNPSLDALVALARRLHRDDPTSMMTIFTDGNAQQFERYRLWDIHRTKPDATRYPAPKAWADRHEIAVIQEFVDRLGAPRRWKLVLFRGSAVRPPVEDGHEIDLE